MSEPKCTALDYIRYLLAQQGVVSATEAARVQPEGAQAPAHDSFTRLLGRLEPDSESLWAEVAPLIRPKGGVLVLDDSTLDKPYARQIDLVGYHWSGKHHAVVRGINLITLLWSDGDRFYPCDFRVYDPREDLTKNDHFAAMLAQAHRRGFAPECVLFDTWYASLENLKAVRNYGWTFLTRLKGNRTVSPVVGVHQPLRDADISAAGTVIHLPGFGKVRVFRLVAANGDTQHWCSNDLGMSESDRLKYAELSWSIEEYHRGIKQCCGVEKCRARYAEAQVNHIGCALRAFVRLEYHRFTTGISWANAKLEIIRNAIRSALQRPLYELPGVA